MQSVRKFSSGVYHRQKCLGKFVELGLANALDFREFFQGGGADGGHFDQGFIGENDIGRDIFVLGQLQAQFFQFGQQQFIAIG